jgi:ribosome maturation factor RimP
VLEREREIFYLVEPAAAAQGLGLVEVGLGRSGRRVVVRVVVHSAAGVTLADCSRVTRSAGHALESAGVFPEGYVLEVSSPGMERVLRGPREFEVFRGRAVRVVLADDSTELEGRAAGSRGDTVILTRSNGVEEVLLWSRIGRARLMPEPPEEAGGRG